MPVLIIGIFGKNGKVEMKGLFNILLYVGFLFLLFQR